ncbi:hypothetical protein L1887_54965 [Cichorium endivia]|nr:hypothetical protein L1887_54965 [Cichorium endivia]
MPPSTTNKDPTAKAERTAKTRRAYKSRKPAQPSDGAVRFDQQLMDIIKSDLEESEKFATASAAQQTAFALPPMSDPSELGQALRLPSDPSELGQALRLPSDPSELGQALRLPSDPSELGQFLRPPPLDENLALWLGAPSLVHDPTQPFRDDHRAGQEVFKKLSSGEPVTAPEDLRYMDDFKIAPSASKASSLLCVDSRLTAISAMFFSLPRPSAESHMLVKISLLSGPRPCQRLHCAAAFPRVSAASAEPQRVLKANGECLFLFQNSKFLGQFRVHTRARASNLLTPPEGGVILSDDFWDHGESTCYTANSSREVVKTILRAGLLLFAKEKRTQADARDLNDLETNTGDITLGLTGTTEAGDEDLVVLVDEVEAAVVGDEGGDLLAVLDELDTDALSDSRVGLLGLDADLLEDDALGLGRATGGGGLVEVAEGALLVGSVGPAVVSAGRDLLTGCVKSTGLSHLEETARCSASDDPPMVAVSWRDCLTALQCRRSHCKPGVSATYVCRNVDAERDTYFAEEGGGLDGEERSKVACALWYPRRRCQRSAMCRLTGAEFRQSHRGLARGTLCALRLGLNPFELAQPATEFAEFGAHPLWRLIEARSQGASVTRILGSEDGESSDGRFVLAKRARFVQRQGRVVGSFENQSPSQGAAWLASVCICRGLALEELTSRISAAAASDLRPLELAKRSSSPLSSRPTERAVAHSTESGGSKPESEALDICTLVTIILHQDPPSVTMPKIYKLESPFTIDTARSVARARNVEDGDAVMLHATTIALRRLDTDARTRIIVPYSHVNSQERSPSSSPAVTPVRSRKQQEQGAFVTVEWTGQCCIAVTGRLGGITTRMHGALRSCKSSRHADHTSDDSACTAPAQRLHNSRHENTPVRTRSGSCRLVRIVRKEDHSTRS